MTDQNEKSNSTSEDNPAAPVPPVTPAASAPVEQVEEIVEAQKPPALPPTRGIDELFAKFDDLEKKITDHFAQAPAPDPSTVPAPAPAESVESDSDIQQEGSKPHAKKIESSGSRSTSGRSRKLKLFKSKRK